MKIKLGIFLLLVVVGVQGKNKKGPDRTPHNIQTVIKLLLGKLCYCSCGDPNFSIDEYRQAEEIEELKNNRNGSEIESQIASTLGKERNPKEDTKGIEGNEKKEIEDAYNEDDDQKNDEDNSDDDDAALAKLLFGDRLKENGFPWSALIIVNRNIYAGGAIITDQHVITTASALFGIGGWTDGRQISIPPREARIPGTPLAESIKVFVGAHDICNPAVTGLNVSVSEYHIHPSYVSSDRRHDIAILTLSSKLALNNNVSLVCLPPFAYSNVLKTAWVASWLSPTPPPANGTSTPAPNCVPKVVRLPILTNDECNRASMGPVTYEKGCLGPFFGYNQICAGDRGAPVLIINERNKFELFGITMDTNICTSNYLAQFIRVDLHVDWIFSKIGSGCICKY